MEDTFTMIIGIGIAIVLMCVIPLITLADRHDDIAQTEIQSITTDFVNECAKTGKITESSWDTFQSKLNSQGNATYDIDIEVAIMNPTGAKKSEQLQQGSIGMNDYYKEYRTSIEQVLKQDGVYYLKSGDRLTIKVQNSSATSGDTIIGGFLKTTNGDSVKIKADATATVVTNGSNT